MDPSNSALNGASSHGQSGLMMDGNSNSPSPATMRTTDSTAVTRKNSFVISGLLSSISGSIINARTAPCDECRVTAVTYPNRSAANASGTQVIPGQRGGLPIELSPLTFVRTSGQGAVQKSPGIGKVVARCCISPQRDAHGLCLTLNKFITIEMVHSDDPLPQYGGACYLLRQY